VERYQRKVFAIAHSIVRKRPDVEDIAQQVFIKVYCAIHKFDFRSALTTWIYRITINECYDYLRKQRPDRYLTLADMSEAESRQLLNAPSPEALPDRRAEMAQMVALILGKLSSDERLLLFLKEVEGYSIQDLSEQLGWNENTVKVRLFRVRRRLARLLRSKTRRRRQGGVHALP